MNTLFKSLKKFYKSTVSKLQIENTRTELVTTFDNINSVFSLRGHVITIAATTFFNPAMDRAGLNQSTCQFFYARTFAEVMVI